MRNFYIYIYIYIYIYSKGGKVKGQEGEKKKDLSWEVLQGRYMHSTYLLSLLSCGVV